VVKLRNPSRGNSLTVATLDSLTTTITTLGQRTDCGCIVITGEDAKFSTGMDIRVLESISSEEDAVAFITSVYNACNAIRLTDKPTIARIIGSCYGAALELAVSSFERLDSSFGSVSSYPRLEWSLH
jgi:enoyl-CoA hydratase/carnithine racemase